MPLWYLPEGTEFATRYVSNDSQPPGMNLGSCDKDTGKLYSWQLFIYVCMLVCKLYLHFMKLGR